jgi:hypothetical protein
VEGRTALSDVPIRLAWRAVAVVAAAPGVPGRLYRCGDRPAIYDLVRRRGSLLQRAFLAAAPVALAAIPLLGYWNLLGLRL